MLGLYLILGHADYLDRMHSGYLALLLGRLLGGSYDRSSTRLSLLIIASLLFAAVGLCTYGTRTLLRRSSRNSLAKANDCR
jgi:hypothetical protein